MDEPFSFKLLVLNKDNEASHQIQLYFSAHNYQVVETRRNHDIFRLALECRPDLIVLMVTPADADSLEVLRALRADHQTLCIPVILLADKKCEHRVQALTALQLGADDYVRGPFDIAELQLRIRNKILFARRQRATATPGDSAARLLIVEDDFDISSLLNVYFRNLGYQVSLAHKGKTGLELAQRENPQLILLDIGLPDISGYEVCRTLRSTPQTSHIPLLFLTQKDQVSDKLQGLELGADDYITKPFDIEELKHRVERTLKSQRQLQRPPQAPQGGTPPEGDTPIRILFLASNPLDTPQLRLDAEMHAIDQALQRAEFRQRFEIKQQWAVQITDIQNHLLRYKPDIVHFSGHGSQTHEIVLEDRNGNSHPVSPRALSQLFAVLKDNIRCVVLNACYSLPQAEAIAHSIDCVIGMSHAIGDQAGLSFATAFYQALGFGRDVQTAFDLGCLEIDLEGLAEPEAPRLIATVANPRQIVFVRWDRPAATLQP